MIRHILAVCITVIACCLPAHAAFEPLRTHPADGSELSSLSTITVFWPGEWLEEIASGVCGRVENESGTQVATLTCEENFSYETPAIDLMLSETITTPGNYTVYVDAETAFNEDYQANEPFMLHYIIGETAPNEIKLISANPENNSALATLSRIETFWSEKISIVNPDVTCQLLDDNDEKVCDANVSLGIFSTDPVTFTFDEIIKTPGRYTLNIPSGALETADGMKSEVQSLTYTVDPANEKTDLEYSVNPSDPKIESEEFPDVEFIFDEEIELITNEFTFESDQQEIITVKATLSDCTVKLDCTEIRQPGLWTLTIPEGSFRSVESGSKNPEKTYQWEFAPETIGIDTIENPGHKLSILPEKVMIQGYDEVRILDLSGNLIALRHGNTEITLKPGFYLIQCIEGNEIATHKILL